MIEINLKNRQKINKYVLERFPHEAVVGIKGGELYMFDNIHPEPENNFKVESGEYLRVKPDALIHSHTYKSGERIQTPNGSMVDPRSPSKADMQTQQALDIPFGIVSTSGEDVSDILWFPDLESPLLGLDYIHGVYDCYRIVRAFYLQQFDMLLPDYPREYGWWLHNSTSSEKDMYMRYYEHGGFSEVSSPQYGDLLLMKIRSEMPCHAGIFVGDDSFIHHMDGRLSTTENYSRWKSKIIKILRHESKLNGI